MCYCFAVRAASITEDERVAAMELAKRGEASAAEASTNSRTPCGSLLQRKHVAFVHFHV